MSHLSTLTLHRLRYGELSGEAAEQARAHLESCAQCAARLRAQENHRAAFELQPVPEALRDLARGTDPGSTAWRWPRWLVAGLALAAAALFAVVAVPRLQDQGAHQADITRLKGSGALFEVWLDTPSGPAILQEGEKVHPEDRIQVRFRRPSAPWATLAGVDVDGQVEIYGSWKADMDTTDWQIAPFALELDDSPGNLRLVLVFTQAKPGDATVEGAARTGHLPIAGEVRTITLEKGS